MWRSEDRLLGVTELIHALGTCKVCTNGDLVFSVLTANGRVIVECLECMTGYLDPRDLTDSATARMEDIHARAATHADVTAAGASDLVID